MPLSIDHNHRPNEDLASTHRSPACPPGDTVWNGGEMKPRSIIGLWCIASTLAVAHVGNAQTFTAQVSGHVSDESGAVLPGVTITATNEETGSQRIVTTADTGAYLVTNLEPGRYTITAELAGFTAVKQVG